MTRLQLEDAIASLDVLAMHSRVDPLRIGAAGQSGGGTLTMMLTAVDERIAAAIVSCGNTENVACRDFCPPGSVDDAEQNFPDSALAGFDRWDLLWPFAPRPLLLLSSARDFLDTYSPNYIRNSREEYRRLAEAYRVLGHADKLRYAESPLPHALSPVLRLELYRWATKWLTRADSIDVEPPVLPEDDRTLWATPTGSVVRDLKSRTPLQSIQARVPVLRSPSASPPDVRKLLRIAVPQSRPKLNVLSSVSSRNRQVSAAEVQSAPGVFIPLWIFAPQRSVPDMIVIIDPKGRNERSQEGDLYYQLAQDAIVCVPDLRGIGDLQPEYSPGAPGYANTHQHEEAYAWASLIFGRPLLGQRVEDLLAVIEALCEHFAETRLRLVAAQGPLTVPALCAAALDTRVTALFLFRHLVSWRSIAEQETYAVPFANFVPGVLNETDLPEIAATLNPRKLILGECITATNERISAQRTTEFYRGPHIRFNDSAGWDEKTLLSLR
jgi:hypothetical protein